jgi:hypothetical protein
MNPTETTVEELRRQIVGWNRYHDLDELKADECLCVEWNKDKPEWCCLVFWFEGYAFYQIMDGQCEGWMELLDSFHKMLEAHGYWYELENSALMWIYKLSEMED